MKAGTVVTRCATKKKRLSLAIVLAAALLVAGGVKSSHASLVLDKFGAFPSNPAGPTDGGLQAIFEPISDGGVRLTLTILSSFYSAKITEWGFNYNGELSPDNFKLFSGSAADNIFFFPKTKADGDGYFDFMFFWDPNNPNYFGSSQNYSTAVYEIRGVGIEPSSFSLTSMDRNGTRLDNGYLSAAHILDWPELHAGTWEGTRVGTFTVVPIPAAAWLLASGLIGLMVIRRRMKKQKLPSAIL